MEGNAVSSYLRSKFSSTLNEAEADLSSYSQIMSCFRSIEDVIKSMRQNSDSMVDPLYELMDVLSECTIFAHQATSKKTGFKYLIRVWNWESKMTGKLEIIKKTLSEIGRDQHRNRSAEHDIQPHPNPSHVEGFKSQVGEIEGWLRDSEKGNQFKAIGIVGMCGCGKTALAQQVFAQSTVEKMFHPRIWVSLSERRLEKERSGLREGILKQILRETGHDASDLEHGGYSVGQLLEKLHLRLKGKRYLIVLDDVWWMDDWFVDLACAGQPATTVQPFTRGLPKESGGAVIVTSRGENVIRRMVGEKHVIRPRLDGDTCWTIFYNAVDQQHKINPNHVMLINKMRDSVINNIQGLPLVANTLANVVSNLLAEKSEAQL